MMLRCVCGKGEWAALSGEASAAGREAAQCAASHNNACTQPQVERVVAEREGVEAHHLVNCAADGVNGHMLMLTCTCMLSQVERVVAEREDAEARYLVKWEGLPYAECTWESEDDVSLWPLRQPAL